MLATTTKTFIREDAATLTQATWHPAIPEAGTTKTAHSMFLHVGCLQLCGSGWLLADPYGHLPHEEARFRRRTYPRIYPHTLSNHPHHHKDNQKT